MSSSLWLDVIRTHDRLLSGEIDGPRISVGAITVWTHPSNKAPPLPPASRDMGEYRFTIDADLYAALQLIVQLRRNKGEAYDPAGVLQEWLEQYVLTKRCTCDLSPATLANTRNVLRQFNDHMPELAAFRAEACTATVQARLTAQQDHLLATRLDRFATEDNLRVSFEEFLATAVAQKAVAEIEQTHRAAGFAR